MANGNRINRHGIPTRGGGPPRPRTCIWPACMELVGWYHKTRMCDEHAQAVAIEVERRRKLVQETEDYFKPPRSAKPEPERCEVIYYVRDGEHIKIGWTTNLRKRLKHGFKPGGQLLATHPGTRGDEVELHRRFAAYRTHGNEWYAPMPSLLHHIELVKQEHGEPESLVVGPSPVGIPQPRDKQYVGGKRIIKPGPVLYGKYR